MAKQGDLILRLRAQTAQAQKQLRDVNTQLRAMGVNAKKTGREVGGMMGGLGGFVGPTVALYATGRALKEVTTQFAGFERTLKLVGLISGSTEEDTKRLGVAAKEMAIELGKTPEQVLAGFQALASAGLSSNDVINVGKDTMKLAAVRAGELGTAAELTAGAIKVFGMEASRSQEIVSQFATAVSKGLKFRSLEDLAETFKYAAGTASTLGLELSDTLATITAFSDATLDTSIAGTAFRRIFASLSQGGPKLERDLLKVGIAYSDVNPKMNTAVEILEEFARASLTAGQATDIFELRAGPALAGVGKIMREGKADIRGWRDEMVSNTARVNTEFTSLMIGMRGEIDKTKAAWNLLKLSIGEQLAPPTTDFLRQLRTIIAGDFGEFMRVKSEITARETSRGRKESDISRFQERHPKATVSGAHDLGAPIIINVDGDIRVDRVTDRELREMAGG